MNGASISIKVGMAEIRLATEPASLFCYGLGSCVGVAIYDPALKLAGLAHVMLPDSKAGGSRAHEAPGRYADTAVAALVAEMARLGARREKMVAKVVGGAHMFQFTGKAPSLLAPLGERNVEAAFEFLERENIPVIGRDIGGTRGRSIEFRPDDGSLWVRDAYQGIKCI